MRKDFLLFFFKERHTLAINNCIAIYCNDIVKTCLLLGGTLMFSTAREKIIVPTIF
jgi:hypothetical protein